MLPKWAMWLLSTCGLVVLFLVLGFFVCLDVFLFLTLLSWTLEESLYTYTFMYFKI